ncbi:transglycosylase SLT domain-containing protein [Candidatus Parcubacteria bacterium]|nr:transglycosylase SLT domain-containing protein [Candidatus Parcubacteria bacterium]
MSKHIISGAILIALLQVPAMPAIESLLPQGISHEVNKVIPGIAIASAFLGDASTPENQIMIEKKKEFVSTREAYPASLAVVEKHAGTIKSVAAQHNVPEDVAIGVALLENGGSETAKSPAGAMGIYQLMPGTAKNLGLTVTKTVDDRKNPEKSIEAGISYLRSNYERFGDWGLATWAYHAGEGNVAKALKIYARANDNLELPGVENSAALRAYVETRGINIHMLLEDPSVQEFTKKLHDDSSGYPYKVIATASLFREANGEVTPR